MNVNCIVDNHRPYIETIFYNKNCTNVSISGKIDELEENLAPPTSPRYQGPLQNLSMRITRVTALAYLNQLKDKKIALSNVGIFVFTERGSRKLHKIGLHI